jgi:hypothetical protein
MEGSDGLLGGAETAIGAGERAVKVLRETSRLAHHGPPLLQEEARERLVLRAVHRELLRYRQLRGLLPHRRRHFPMARGLGWRGWIGFGVQVGFGFSR